MQTNDARKMKTVSLMMLKIHVLLTFCSWFIEYKWIEENQQERKLDYNYICDILIPSEKRKIKLLIKNTEDKKKFSEKIK